MSLADPDVTLRVGFVGLGAMGAGMARCVLGAGFPLTILTSSPDKAHSFQATGAAVAATAVDLVAASDVIVTCVPDGSALAGIFDTESGFGAADFTGRTLVDCSTIAPGEARAMAARVAAQGGDFVDAPVSGGVKGAAEGNLTIMCGGDQDTVARVMPVLDSMGRSIARFGPIGAGQAVKAANQLMVAVNMMGAFEAISLVRANGVDPGEMREALMTGAARSGVLEMHAARYLSGALEGGFRIELLRKDLGLVAAAGEAGGLSQPAASLALQLVRAACNAGFEGQDSAVLGRIYDILNGKDAA